MHQELTASKVCPSMDDLFVIPYLEGPGGRTARAEPDVPNNLKENNFQCKT